jgi:hypothetical protein
MLSLEVPRKATIISKDSMRWNQKTTLASNSIPIKPMVSLSQCTKRSIVERTTKKKQGMKSQRDTIRRITRRVNMTTNIMRKRSMIYQKWYIRQSTKKETMKKRYKK